MGKNVTHCTVIIEPIRPHGVLPLSVWGASIRDVINSTGITAELFLLSSSINLTKVFNLSLSLQTLKTFHRPMFLMRVFLPRSTYAVRTVRCRAVRPTDSPGPPAENHCFKTVSRFANSSYKKRWTHYVPVCP